MNSNGHAANGGNAYNGRTDVCVATSNKTETGTGDRPCIFMPYLDFTTLDGMTGEVTHNDIAEGQQGICDLCPVARAVSRMFKGFQVYVELDTMTIHENGETYAVLFVGDALAEWIDQFDNENNVQPIKLKITTWNTRGYKYMISVADTEATAA